MRVGGPNSLHRFEVSYRKTDSHYATRDVSLRCAGRIQVAT